MNRAERRRAQKNKKSAETATYNFTKEQIDSIIEKSVGEKLKEIRENAKFDAIDASLSLTLVLPMKILMEKYWANDSDMLQMFADDLFELYEQWMNGEVDLNVEKEKIWEIAGVKFAEVEDDE